VFYNSIVRIVRIMAMNPMRMSAVRFNKTFDICQKPVTFSVIMTLRKYDIARVMRCADCVQLVSSDACLCLCDHYIAFWCVRCIVWFRCVHYVRCIVNMLFYERMWFSSHSKY